MRLASKLLALAIATLALASPSAHADALGTTTSGELRFIDHSGPNFGYGDTPYTVRPANYFTSSSAVIGSGVEFSFYNGINGNPSIGDVSANFDGASLTITTYPVSFIDHYFTFTDPAFFGITYTGTDPDIHASIVGHTITIQSLSPPLHYKTQFTGVPDVFLLSGPPLPPPTPSAVPEPGTLLMVGTGALSALAAARRKFNLR
jgi:hypothetical protein